MTSFQYPLCEFPGERSSFDCAGVYCPADDVPSTVLEKHSLLHGTVVFAIGDTGGHAEALPVLCVRHYLRRSLGERASDPVAAAENMNQLIYDCCGSGCSLSCFYAEYSRDTRLLRYVNAGHDAPVLIRSNPDEVIRLEAGGPVLGLRESPAYVEGFVTLKEGDRLVAFTQGVIDSLAAGSGRGAEHVLISIARSRRSSSAFELASRIVAECEAIDPGKKVEKGVFVASVVECHPSQRASRSEAILVPATRA